MYLNLTYSVTWFVAYHLCVFFREEKLFRCPQFIVCCVQKY